jgi:tRNA(Arg) A34 adenosine deaminase TadA
MAYKRLKTKELMKWTPILSTEYTNTTFTLKPFMIADVKDNKLLSTLIVQLQKAYPFSDQLRYKRVRKVDLLAADETKQISNFQVLLTSKDEFHGLPPEIEANLLNLREYELPIDRILTRRQYDLATKNYWPLQFHLDKNIESLLDGSFMTKKSDLMTKYDYFACLALDLARFFDSKSAAVLVDLKTNTIVGCGLDGRSVFALNHSTIDAINNISKRQMTEIKNGQDYEDDRLGLFFESQSSQHEAFKCDLQKKLDLNDFLCTNYAIFLTHEPCSMCSMALVHSRIAKIFYVFNTEHGYVNTRQKLHLIKSLNHTFEVYEACDMDTESNNLSYFHQDTTTKHPHLLPKNKT